MLLLITCFALSDAAAFPPQGSIVRTTGTSSGLDKLKSVMRFNGSHSIGAFLLAVCACWAGGFLAPVQAEDWDHGSHTSGTYSVQASEDAVTLTTPITLDGSLNLTGSECNEDDRRQIQSPVKHRHFVLNQQEHTLSLACLTLVGVGDGGGIKVEQGTLVIDKCKFMSNIAPQQNGAIFIGNNNTDRSNLPPSVDVIITDSMFLEYCRKLWWRNIFRLVW